MALAYLAPDAWVNYRTRTRREHIRLGLPDALDLMVVCVDAGLGIDQALLRSGQELALSQPEISEEFIQINFEQRAGKPRIEAWQSMADRTRLDTVNSFVHMLAQTDRFWHAHCKGVAGVCRFGPPEAPPAGRRAGRQDHRQTDFSPGAVHLSQHLHRAAGTAVILIGKICTAFSSNEEVTKPAKEARAMDTVTVVRVIAAALVVVLLGVVVMRRKKHA